MIHVALVDGPCPTFVDDVMQSDAVVFDQVEVLAVNIVMILFYC